MTSTLFRMVAVYAIAIGLFQASARAGESISALLDPYFRIQSQLTDDKADGLRADAELVATAADSLGDRGSAMAAAARELGAATSLATARDAFGKLSDALIAYAEPSKADVGDQAVTVYCPMVKKSWMQKGSSVRNPYFGKSKPGCGEIRKKG